MKRAVKPNEIHLTVNTVETFQNDKHSGIVIEWDSDIGFGEYTIYRKEGSSEWFGDSEHMDHGEDKDFIKELLRLFVEKITVKD